MKFKVTRNIRPNMFGKITGSTTLAGTKACPYDIEWLIDEIVSINYFGVKDDERMQEVRDFLLEQLKVLEVNNGYSVNDDGGVLALLIERVPEETTLADVFMEELKEHGLWTVILLIDLRNNYNKI